MSFCFSQFPRKPILMCFATWKHFESRILQAFPVSTSIIHFSSLKFECRNANCIFILQHFVQLLVAVPEKRSIQECSFIFVHTLMHTSTHRRNALFIYITIAALLVGPKVDNMKRLSCVRSSFRTFLSLSFIRKMLFAICISNDDKSGM